jgi:hypothetical protein
MSLYAQLRQQSLAAAFTLKLLCALETLVYQDYCKPHPVHSKPVSTSPPGPHAQHPPDDPKSGTLSDPDLISKQ